LDINKGDRHDHARLAIILDKLALVCQLTHKNQEGISYAREALKYITPGSYQEGNNHRQIGDLAFALQDYATAAAELSKARPILSRSNTREWADVTEKLALTKECEGDFSTAMQLLNEEADCWQKMGRTEMVARAKQSIAECQAKSRQHQDKSVADPH
jgi:tetratricopeptide (TPR) repeat protein